MNTYFKRYAYPLTLFSTAPDPKLKLSVVIPCYNEPDIIPSLESINKCSPMPATEVIVIVNEPEGCSIEIQNSNQSTLDQIKKWEDATDLNFELLTYHFIAPAKHAGVGLARKIGMDEAARRFERVNNDRGVICCFDADSTCSPNYMDSIYQHFYVNYSNIVGASIYYEHSSSSDPIVQNAILEYELHLRYYVHALQFISYPFAHQTVGSCMAVRSNAYQHIGGMNKRKAGEDFYFLHRLMPSGDFIDIKNTTVYPSPRESDRVPFGTGRAIGNWKRNDQKEYLTYNLKSFLDLGVLFRLKTAFYNCVEAEYQKLINQLPDPIQVFLIRTDLKTSLDRINIQSTTMEVFQKNWFAYFDGFRVLKYIHFARDNFYPNQPVCTAADKLLKIKWKEETLSAQSPSELLEFYRSKDRASSGD